jgi:DNA-binding NarL/FixJ family response regulator
MEATPARTAVVADAHPLALETVERVITQLGIEVAGRTTKVERVRDLVDDHNPDLLILGVESVDDEVQQLLGAVQESCPHLRVVLVSEANPRSAHAAFSAGVDAYCTRAASEGDLAAAVRQSFARSIHLPPVGIRADAFHLTRREVQVLQLLAEGRSNAEIARALWITPQTVKFHLSNIYRKLGVANRTEASRRALHYRLVDVSPNPLPADRAT